MLNKDYIEGLMRSLTPDQVKQIRDHYADTSTPADYVIFRAFIFNSGHVVTISFNDVPEGIDTEYWNGYDVLISTSDTVTLLDKYNL